jgi:hypothetical protein
MKQIQKIRLYITRGSSGITFIAFPPLLLIIVVVALMALMVSVCIKFTKGPLSTAALLQQLQHLQARFASGKQINPEREREEMEILQNKIKTTSDPITISENMDLKRLFYSNCKSIQGVLGQADLQNRTSWIKLNGLMVEFNSRYFRNPD